MNATSAGCVAGLPGERGTFTVRADVRPGDHVRLEVSGGGGVWEEAAQDRRQHGLEIVSRLASETGVAGGPHTGWVIWARLDWPASPEG